MSTPNKIRSTPFMTPRVTLVYPKLNAPDTKFKPEGEFATKANFSAEEAAPFVEKYEAEVAKHFEAVKAELSEKLKAAKTGAEKGKLKKELDDLKQSDSPFKPVFDDDGNETGEVQVNFKLPAVVKNKATGKETKLYPKFADARGKAIDFSKAPAIWGGTIARIQGEFRPFYTAKAGVGCSIRLNAVQIIDLKSGGQGRDPGFGDEGEGYEADEDSGSPGFTDEGGSAPSDAPDNF